MQLVFDTGMGIPGGYADMDITGTGTDGHFHIRRHTRTGPLKVPSDAVSEKSKNGSIFIRKVLPNFHPLAGFGLRPGQF